MDPNALPSTSQTATTSTSTESHLKHLPSHDVAVFGASCDLRGLNLPTKQDILRCFFFLAERAKLQNKMFSYKTFVPHVTDKLIEIWSQLNVEIVRKKSVARKLGTLIDKYHIETKHPKIATFRTFVQSTKELFYIGKCQCDLKAALCSCGLIPDHLKEFMRDQNNVRRLTIPEFVPEVEEPATTSTIIPTSVEETHLAYEPSTDTDEPSSNPQDVPPMIRGPYTPRYDASNFAAMCDRFGVSDRIAAALATSLMQDIDVKDAHGNPIIMDKNKVRREKAKCREELLRKQYDASNLIAFSFDGRKNDALTVEKIDEKLHPRMVKEPHLVVLKEPNSQLIGYTKVENEDAEHKLMTLNAFFVEKEIALDALIGICCDGEPTNTGVRNGILRRFELHLNRPLHWFVCLLHFNELPFRHLFNTLDRSSTTGPRTTTGTLGKQIETCENLPVCIICHFSHRFFPLLNGKISFNSCNFFFFSL